MYALQIAPLAVYVQSGKPTLGIQQKSVGTEASAGN